MPAHADFADCDIALATTTPLVVVKPWTRSVLAVCALQRRYALLVNCS